MEWRVQRQLIIVGILVAVVGGFLFFIYQKTRPIPTCFDHIQNQGEEGVDCGGPCIPCRFLNKQDVQVIFAKAFQARPGSYDAIASIINPNSYYGSYAIKYEFDLFDENGTEIAVRNGSDFILPNESFYIIEPDIRTTLTVASVSFKVISVDWTFVQHPATPRDVTIVQRTYSVVTNVRNVRQSVVNAQILNNTLTSFPEVLINLVLLDKDKNAIGINKTSVENLQPGETRPLTFSWPEVITGTPESIEGQVRINQLAE